MSTRAHGRSPAIGPVEAGWLEYAVDVIGPDADDQDVLLLQLAFYSGAASAVSAARRALRAAQSVEAALAALLPLADEVISGAERVESRAGGGTR